jgi:hypothetical protein
VGCHILILENFDRHLIWEESMSTVMEDFQADFSNALADAFSASTNPVIQQLAAPYGDLATLYAAAAGRPVAAQTIDFQKDLDTVESVFSSDDTFEPVLMNFGEETDNDASLNIDEMAKIFVDALPGLADTSVYTGAGADLTRAIADALTKVTVGKKDVVSFNDFYEAMSAVVLFSNPAEEDGDTPPPSDSTSDQTAV